MIITTNVTEPNCPKCRIRNRHGHVTTLPIAIPDAEFLAVRFFCCVLIIIIIIIINIHLYTTTYRKTRTVVVYKLKWGIK